MERITVRYTGNRYAGKIDDGRKPLQPGTVQFEATGPRSAFEAIEGHRPGTGHVKVIDRTAVTVKEYQVL